jgi:hypothetical protein
MDCMEKEFEDYWNKHQKRLILNAPKALRDEYFESTKLVYRLEKAIPNDGHCLSCIITKRNFISHSVAYTPVRQEYSYMQDG